MSFIRRRYYTWLFKAYINRWFKTILTSFIIGAGVFFAIVFLLNFYISPLIQKKVQRIGYWGTYTASSIPQEVLSDVSYGLTAVRSDGRIEPAASYRWQIKEGGREYIFYIKKGQHFHDGRELTAESIPINFKDVKKRVIDEYTIALTLNESYSPFLSIASKPIIGNKFSGLGDYKLKKLDLNAGFVKSITLQHKNDPGSKKIINFYPTQEALKVAYSLGEVDRAVNISDPTVKASDMLSWINTKGEKNVDYAKLVTLFYNNSDKSLSSKRLRQALNYSIPESFTQGERSYSPIPPNSIYFSESPNYGVSDIEIAKNLIEPEKELLNDNIEISTLEEYKDAAEKISASWKLIGVKSTIKVADGLPSNFQVLIYPINLPPDPDQYTLWHSSQINNIVKYKNLRIDKLLEDGRSITDIEDRINIYADFQKYMLDDVPASFLYFPYEYTIIRN